MLAYKLPSLSSITLHSCSKDEQVLSPSLMHRLICTKIIAFTAQHTRPSYGGHIVECSLAITDSQGKHQIYFSTFMVPELVPWTGESITHFIDGECEEGQVVYAAKISTSTQVVFGKVLQVLSVPFRTQSFAMANSDMQMEPVSRQPRPLQSAAVVSAVFGFAGSVFGDEPGAAIAVSDSKCASLHINSVLAPESRFGALLITGPSGSGTSTLAHSIAAKYGASCICVSTGVLYASGTRSFTRDWAQQQVLSHVMRAVALRRCVLVLEDLHYLTPRRGGSSSSSGGGSGGSGDGGASEDRSAAIGVGVGSSAGHTDAEEGFIEAIAKLVANIRALVESLRASDGSFGHNSDPVQLLVVGCAYDERMVDARVVDCFQEKVVIPLPTAQERRKIMRLAWVEQVVTSDSAHTTPTITDYPSRELDAMADALSGTALVPLYHGCMRCASAFLKQTRAKSSNAEDSVVMLTKDEPFSKVAGLQVVKAKLVETVLWPRRHAVLYRSFAAIAGQASSNGENEEGGSAVSFAAGILLFGPPGTGKTLLPRVLADELGCALVNMRISDVVRGEVGTSERRVAQLFQEAKSCAPCVVFIDEFQALFTAREEGSGGSGDGGTLTAALAGCFDDINTWNRHAGAESLVTVIASTNEPWAIDAGFLRPGRLDMCVFVGPLDAAGREEFLVGHIARQHQPQQQGSAMDAAMEAGLCRRVAAVTEGFTGADLTLLLSRAQELSYLRNSPSTATTAVPVLCWADFQAALQNTRASTTPGDVEEYLDWQRLYPYL